MLTRSKLIRRLKRMPSFDAEILHWHLRIALRQRKYTPLRYALIRALISHPNLLPRDWVTFCRYDGKGALQNPALPLWLVEDPSLPSQLGYVPCNVLVNAAMELRREDMLTIFHAAGHQASRFFNSDHCKDNGHRCCSGVVQCGVEEMILDVMPQVIGHINRAMAADLP